MLFSVAVGNASLEASVKKRLSVIKTNMTDFDASFQVIYQKTSASVSSGVPNTEKQMIYCFEVFGTPDETRSTSFWYSFLNELPIIIVCKQ